MTHLEKEGLLEVNIFETKEITKVSWVETNSATDIKVLEGGLSVAGLQNSKLVVSDIELNGDVVRLNNSRQVGELSY